MVKELMEKLIKDQRFISLVKEISQKNLERNFTEEPSNIKPKINVLKNQLSFL